MYNTDKPIECINNDLLGRSSFSKQLGKALCNYPGTDSLVVGLFGRWGTGKTSVINMALQEISEISNGSEKSPIIIKFSPWNYSSQDNLILQFFKCIESKIALQENDAVKKKIGKALADYADAFDIVSVIPVVGGIIAPIAKTAANSVGKRLSKQKDLDESKKVLEEALLEYDRKIIIVIDDIDRLSNVQIRDIFQLVKQVADLPNMLYVLAMDRDVVTRALNDVQHYDGNDYLEKIIQIPFVIPEISEEKLHYVFFKKLDEVIFSNKEYNLDKYYWNKIFENCIKPYIKTLRDVNRIINSFQFRFGVLSAELCLEEIVALTVLDVIEPQLFKWISQNKELVCGSVIHSLLVGHAKPEEIRKKYIEEFEKMNISSDKAIKAVATLFPVFAKDINEHTYGYCAEENKRGQMRIAQSERYDLFFLLDLEQLKVSRKVLLDFINIYSEEEIDKVIDELNDEETMPFFLNELQALLPKVEYKRIKMIINSLFRKRLSLVGEDTSFMFMISSSDRAEFCIEELLKKLQTDEERFEILLEQICSGNVDLMASVSKMINHIELSYGRLASNKEEIKDQIISLEQLKQLENAYTTEIKKYAGSIINHKEFYIMFYLWKCFDKENAEKYISKCLKNEDNCLKYICRMSGRWSGTAGVGWKYNAGDDEKYIADQELLEIVNSYDKKIILNEYTELELIQIASFVLNFKRDEMYHVNVDKAKELIEKWQNKVDDGGTTNE